MHKRPAIFIWQVGSHAQPAEGGPEAGISGISENSKSWAGRNAQLSRPVKRKNAGIECPRPEQTRCRENRANRLALSRSSWVQRLVQTKPPMTDPRYN